MKRKLQNFFDQFCIKNKIIVACLPFIILSYVIVFVSVTLILYEQMRTMVYEQTRQNIIEKTKLLDTLLRNYDQMTTNYLYYTKDIQDYLVTDQAPLSQEEVEKLHRRVASHTALLLTDQNAEIMQVSLFNQAGDLYTNNAIYSNTLETAKAYADSIHALASAYHGKLILETVPGKPHMLTVARTVYIPTLQQSNQEIGFLLLHISRSALESQLRMQQNSDAIFTLLTDARGKILINTSGLDNAQCEAILRGDDAQKGRYTVDRRALSYSGCFVTTMIDESVLFADTYRLFRIEIFAILVSVSILLFAIIFAGNMISAQVSRFIRKLNETRQIDENAYISVESKDEFQQLGVVYNNMLSRIDHLIHTVYLKEILTQNAQLESLQAQINPHFLYNTLDCVNSLVDMGEKESVKKVVTSLANIMRMSIKGDTFITLQEDLSYIRQYIFIQKMRFQDKILFLTEVPESLYQYYIPKLTLQPLVENAIIHGVSDLTETGMIGIFGREDEHRLYIDIKDNGNGMPPEIIEQLRQMDDTMTISSKHIGIFNIQRKLQILYGTDYGLTVTGVSSHGTSVTICIPKSTCHTERIRIMKLLIVDDEPLILKRLEQLIVSSAVGIHEVYATSNPAEALEMLKECAPQILITDIRMPKVSGVDLARYAYENQMQTLVIFVTGYSDFEYAKSGIAYQVFDYLLKPIDEEESLRTVKKAVSTIQEKQKHDEIHSMFQNYFSTHFVAARRQFLEKLLFHPLTHTKEQLVSIQKQFQMDTDALCLCAVRFTCSSGFGEDFYYSYMTEQYLNRSFSDFLTYPFGDMIYMLWLPQNGQPAVSAMYGRFQEIREKLEMNYPVRVFAGISDFTDDLSKVQLLRKQVARCLEHTAQKGAAPIAFFSDLPDAFVHEEYFDMVHTITKLIRLLRMGEKVPVQQEYEKITRQFQGRTDSYISEMIDLITSNILLFIQGLSIPSTELAKMERQILVPLRQQTDVQLKLQYVQYWLDYLVDWIFDAQAAEQNRLMQSIYDYIDTNFGDSIGLASLSEHVNRNPSYLSRFIKQQTNKNFSQILTGRRMEEAKSLLRTTSLKVPQIAQKTGYPNVRYFNRVFHSHFSMSPTDYRKVTAAFFN